MKNYILLLVIILALASCQEEEFTPEKNYTGIYSYESRDLEFTFDLIREHSIYKGEDAAVSHDAISGSEGRNSLVILRYSSVRDVYDQIIIRSHAPVYWSVEMNGVILTDAGMEVNEIRVMMPRETEAIIENQFVRKLNL
jgi:hypothetical protein